MNSGMTVMGGYIKLDRNILEWEWWSDINTYRLFTYMLLAANWKDGKFKGIDVPRGSFVSSISKLSIETNLTVDETRTAIKHLKSTGEITSKSHSKFTVFTVKNYCEYQSVPKQNTEQTPIKSQAVTNQIPTIEEGKKEINNKYIYAYAREENPPKLFEKFWNTYPKRVSRMLAEQAYVQLLSTTEGLREEQVVAAAKNYAEACRILKRTDKFICTPHNWLEKSVWIDYLPENYKKPEATRLKREKGTGFTNFEQRDYDFDELEKQLLESQEAQDEQDEC